VELNTQDCIISSKNEIFEKWLNKTKTSVPATSGQTRPALINSLSEFLDHLNEMLKKTNSAASDIEYRHLASGHGIQRAKVGNYTLLQITTEFSILQEVIFSVLKVNQVSVSVDDAKIISLCFQTAVAESCSAFVEAVEEARERSEIQFKLLVQEATDYAIFMIDVDGFILSWNDGAERLKQFTSKEAIGQNFAMLYRQEDIKERRPERNLKLAQDRGRHEEQWWRKKKDGTLFWADVVMTPIRTKKGELLGFSKIVRDLTSKKHTEDELRAAKASAEEANSLKTIFVANMSHEIRTPLGAILGFSEILKDADCSTQDRILATEVIERNGKILLRLIEDILDISKIEAGKLEIEIGEVTIRPLAIDVLTLFEKRASDKGISLNLQADTDVPETICSDPLRLRQILSNVIGNAVKFTERGAVTVQIHCRKMDHPSSFGIEFIVTDTGAGLTEKERNGLFAPFSQADSTATRKFGGTGLGLALSRRLANKLGGDVILLDNQSPAGCTFKISISSMNRSKAKLIVKEPQPDKIANPPSPEQIRKIADKNVLVVDDSADNRALIQVLLRKWGIECDFASNGAEAVEIAMNKSYDLILMDIQMPILDGNQAMRKLRDLKYEGQIVALTAHAMSEEKSKAYDAGCDDYLIKPIDKLRLFEVLENCSTKSI
jgi:PAS domain S-box-containing protein